MAQRKAASLLDAGARVVVVSPAVTSMLARWARDGRITHRARRFRPADLDRVWLVIAATDDAVVNEAVFRVATRKRIFVNVVDQPARCSFIAPSILRRGDVVIAVSTGGASPTMAKRLRRELAQRVGTEYGQLAKLFGGLRAEAKQRLPKYAQRKRFFEALMDSPVVDLVRRGRVAQARRDARRRLRQAVDTR